MEEPGHLGERLRFYAGFAGGAAWLLACSVAGFARLAFGPKDRSATTFYARIFCRPLVRALGWSIRVDRPDVLRAAGPCIFVANHQSMLDVVVFGAIVPPRTVALGKKEIGRIPLFGWFFRAAGNLIVDRGDSVRAAETLARAGEIVSRERISVWIMPEGHRNGGPELLPFRSGAFRLAAAARVPLVPVVAEPLAAVVDTRARRTRRGTLRIRVLDAIDPPGSDPAAIAETAAEIRRRMQEAFDGLARTAPVPSPSS